MINNNFEIRHAGRVIRRHNSIRNVFDFYRTYRKMCSCMYAYLGEVNYYFGVPTLVASNFDPSAGRLFATYQLEIPADELNGETIVKVGFASSKSPDLVVNDCEVGLVKEVGEPLIITGTLYLNCASDSMNLTYLTNFNEGEEVERKDDIMQTGGEVRATLLAGDNKLVRMLLGTESFDSALFRMTYGTDNTPQSAFVYEENYPSVFTEPVMTDSSIEFSGTISASATDVVLLHDGKAVLRIMPVLETRKTAVSIIATEQNAVSIITNGINVGLWNVKINSIESSDYTVTRLPSALTLVRTEREKLPAAALIKSDTGGRYFAAIKDGQGTFFTLSPRGLSVTGFFDGVDIMMCEDGSAFIIKDSGYVPGTKAIAAAAAVGIDLSTGGLSVLSGLTGDSDGNPIVFFKDGKEIPLGLRAEKSYAAAYSTGDTASEDENKGSYVLTLLKNTDLYTYIIDADFGCDSVVDRDFSAYADEGARLFSVPGAVCAASNTSAPICYDKNGKNNLRIYWLSAICNAEWFLRDTVVIYDSRRVLLYDSYFDRTNYFTDMGTTEVISTAYGMHYGEINVRNKGLSVDISCIGETAKLLTLLGSVIFARAVGRFLYLFFADGSVKAYFIGFTKLRLRSGSITKGFPVTLLQEKVLPKSGKFCIRIKRN